MSEVTSAMERLRHFRRSGLRALAFAVTGVIKSDI